jgi:hypothetical protein
VWATAVAADTLAAAALQPERVVLLTRGTVKFLIRAVALCQVAVDDSVSTSSRWVFLGDDEKAAAVAAAEARRFA